MSARAWLFLALLVPALALAQMPQRINYQGYLTSSAGEPVNGLVSLTFRLYDAPVDGMQVWQESQSTVFVTNGRFNVSLGAMSPLSPALFTQPLYLSVQANEDAAMVPRQPLASSPYAFRSESAVIAETFTGQVSGTQIVGVISLATLSGSTLTGLDARYGQAANLQPTAAAANVVTVVDTAGDVGQHSSITIGAGGRPVISYYDATKGELKLARCGNAACSAGNAIAIVNGSGDRGRYSSITIGADGLPVISYFDVTNGDLKVAKCLFDASCPVTAVNTPDAGVNMGQYTAIAIGADGFPVISHYDFSNGALRVVKCQDAECSIHVRGNVDAVDTTGSHTSIAIGADGLPVISYFDSTNARLKVAKCADAECQLPATINQASSLLNIGHYSSIAIGMDGLPVISYYDFNQFDLIVTKCGNAACSAGNTTTRVDTDGQVGRYTSLAIGADGLPVISYFDTTNSSIKVAKCGNADCSSGNTISTVAVAGNTGGYTSIAIGADGLPVVSFYDGDTLELKVAKCGNAFCAPVFRRR